VKLLLLYGELCDCMQLINIIEIKHFAIHSCVIKNVKEKKKKEHIETQKHIFLSLNISIVYASKDFPINVCSKSTSQFMLSVDDLEN
jgi:hypothetical protein